jgi:uncharacterized membrane protein
MFPVIIDIATIVCLGLMTGNELCISLFVHPALRRLSDEPSRARALGVIAAALGKAMPVWYVLTFVLLAAEAYIHRTYATRDLFYVAVVLLVFVILTTITVLVPINNRIAKLVSTAPYPGWQQDHHRWDRLHWVRILMLIVAFLCVLVGIVF